MKMNTDLIKFIISVSIILLMLFFGFMWYRSSNKLKNTERQLNAALSTITSLQTDNENLVKYISEKDEKIKEIEQEYQEVLNNIPADECGNAKPSKILLQYYRKNK